MLFNPLHAQEHQIDKCFALGKEVFHDIRRLQPLSNYLKFSFFLDLFIILSNLQTKNKIIFSATSGVFRVSRKSCDSDKTGDASKSVNSS